jgi:hypothetical protein
MEKTQINITPDLINKKSQSILNATQKEMGFVPNMYQSMDGNAGLLDGYLHAYNAFRKHSGFTPVEQEVIFISVAYVNACEYLKGKRVLLSLFRGASCPFL